MLDKLISGETMPLKAVNEINENSEQKFIDRENRFPTPEVRIMLLYSPIFWLGMSILLTLYDWKKKMEKMTQRKKKKFRINGYAFTWN